MNKKVIKYCSLDIETSGFDPERCETLEVGFAFFELRGNGLKVVEKWSQVFHPKTEVSSRILGLTGISKKELDLAPDFQDYKNFLQDKLGNSIIVGHNVGFDIKFLEKSGIVFMGQVIDTMDLVQILLPTHHSYNLENLMHFFELSHTNAHRALADSLAVVGLLECLMEEFHKLPFSVQKQMDLLAKKINASWREIFFTSKTQITKKTTANKNKSITAGNANFVIEDKTIYSTDTFQNPVNKVKSLVELTKEKLFIVVPKRHQVLEYWKQGVVRGVVGANQRLNLQKVKSLIDSDFLNSDETKFLMKILVWLETNWQQEAIIDLNLSFFGGQFKDLVCDGELPNFSSERVLCCDHDTFIELKNKSLLHGRSLVVIGLGEFEKAVTNTIGQRVSWGYFSYLLKSIYNPELSTGNNSLSEIIVQTLTDADLFFGLTNALLIKFNKGLGDITLTDDLRNSSEYSQISKAAESFVIKLRTANKILNLSELGDFSDQLEEFFQHEENYVKWISVSELKCVLRSLPLNISELVLGLLSGASKVSFIDNNNQFVLKYFSKRLGIDSFSKTLLPAKQLTWLSSLLRKFKNHTSVVVKEHKPGADVLQVVNKKSAPAVLILENPQDISSFYKENYGKLRKDLFLLAQQAEGGTNKLFHNFSIHKNSLLLVSDKAVVRFVQNHQQAAPVDSVPAKTLVFSYLPNFKAQDPYSQILAAQYSNPEDEYFLPLALYNFGITLQFFHTPNLRTIYVFTSKKAHKYEQVYLNFLSQYIKNAE